MRKQIPLFNNDNIIKSFSFDQDEILCSIESLYCKGGFDLDLTFSTGGFWKNLSRPRFVFDIKPQRKGVIPADAANIPLKSNCVRSIVFDPPFLFSGKTYKMVQRFGGFFSLQEMLNFYKAAIIEACRVLKTDGKLVFKCQDVVHGRTQYLIHCDVIKMAEANGFRAIDIFILLHGQRIIQHNLINQNHARKFHSYFLVFRKKRCNGKAKKA